MRPPRNSRRIDGFLLLDKPRGIGSNASLQHVKRVYRAERAGHTGTLDPMASGLLPVCLGEATKFAGELLEADKAYRAEVTLGVRTTTGDAEGGILERRPVRVSDSAVREALQRFRGPILQVPPMHSALKRDGVPLYAYARRGQELERQARGVTIHALEMVESGSDRLTLDVACSKGTYVRVLAEDLGEALGCGAHLSGLVRTRIGPFLLEQAVTVDALEALDEAGRDALLLPVDALLASWARVELAEDEAVRFRHGSAVALVPANPTVAGQVRIYGPRGAFLGTGTIEADGTLRPKRLLADAPQSGARPPCA
jgi:tRNA pseudouridine55 synthase